MLVTRQMTRPADVFLTRVKVNGRSGAGSVDASSLDAGFNWVADVADILFLFVTITFTDVLPDEPPRLRVVRVRIKLLGRLVKEKLEASRCLVAS